jgi:hypothetical protein
LTLVEDVYLHTKGRARPIAEVVMAGGVGEQRRRVRRMVKEEDKRARRREEEPSGMVET